jgi:hypothetical protein
MGTKEHNFIERFFYCWGGLPWKKPVAMTSDLVFLVLWCWCCIRGHDMPPTIAKMADSYLIFINLFAFSSSTLETIFAGRVAGKMAEYGAPLKP